MRPLDQRLYDWLAEPDDRRFARAFNAYFTVAFPAVVRHLVRISHWDPAQCEDLAQDALLRFFEKVGTNRRQASDAILGGVNSLRPLNLGAFHTRQVDAWTSDVKSFREAAIGFRLPTSETPDDNVWKSTIRGIADRIPSLQRTGDHFLQTVQSELQWSPSTVTDEGAADSTRLELALSVFVDQLLTDMAGRSERASAADNRLPGVAPFCENTLTVVRNLPRLRVPTNSYLFEIALSIYLDECKKRGRKTKIH